MGEEGKRDEGKEIQRKREERQTHTHSHSQSVQYTLHVRYRTADVIVLSVSCKGKVA